MKKDPVRGKGIRWSYDDGPMKGKTFEHTFSADGTVRYRELDGKQATSGDGGEGPGSRYEVDTINDGVYAVSYLTSHGWTLTTVVDTASHKIVSYASNEKELMAQHGKLL